MHDILQSMHTKAVYIENGSDMYELLRNDVAVLQRKIDELRGSVVKKVA